MKISILGTNGFLSNAIGKYANEHGWQLDMYGLDAPVAVRCDKFYPIDLLNREMDCESMLDSDMIIYAIGAGIQYNLNEGANMIYALNVTAPVSICTSLKALGFKGVFVTFGSYFELGETDIKYPATECEVINSEAFAPSDYIVSKRMLTRYATSYKHDFTHWHFILPTIFGPGENPKRLIPYTINAIRNNEELHYTSGEQVRQYLYVEDVTKVLDAAYAKSLPSGIYNIEGNETLSVKAIVTAIHEEFNKSIPDGCFGEVQRFDTSMSYLALDGSKLKDKIGNLNQMNLVDILKQY